VSVELHSRIASYGEPRAISIEGVVGDRLVEQQMDFGERHDGDGFDGGDDRSDTLLSFVVMMKRCVAMVGLNLGRVAASALSSFSRNLKRPPR